MINRRDLLKQLALGVPALALGKNLNAAQKILEAPGIGYIPGRFKPTWESLSSYQTPEWFRNAKFGIWAHWGPQCQPEHGDWYAREMYMEGSRQNKYHLEKYGHPSKFGFKDVINEWKAEKWDPQELLSLYKNAGAKYFMALANHHDNFDLFKSSYQSKWNSTKIGPKQDIIKGWEKAARSNGMHFGVSVHAAHAWTWMETAQRSDLKGDMAGIPYDGKLTAADGKGKWWNGLNPQDLYAQNHALSENSWDNNSSGKQWDWGNGASVPSKQYCEKFYNRTIELIDNYAPDLIYFDDTALPLWPVSDVGLRIASYAYNKSIQKNNKLEAVIFGKILDKQQRKCMVWDIERGHSNEIEPLPWQADTCLGSWHYDRTVYDNNSYKNAKTVVHTLADVVSKNGNLLLSVPVRGNGTIDEIERSVVEEIGDWMSVNSEAIYDTRPWKVFGEGPSTETRQLLKDQGFNEGKNKPFTSADIRFTKKVNSIYAIVMGWPEGGSIRIKAMKRGSPNLEKPVSNVVVTGTSQKLAFTQGENFLEVNLSDFKPKHTYAFALKIS
ncbi:alpha-L-fucosidase [Pedobacter sp. MC2016-05]|uniref:alpha-L-fucosidase n=1 Tax=Pedobacter sp. MC2016-05 TaxID=2994474 RepID=UPI002248496B|nr:alpha-L-fucosidase [Pedobacter sp. MC2016-05]MCX2475378.1 alpha-L-fucosidase [Pedobacter sp. MC2016-05]